MLVLFNNKGMNENIFNSKDIHIMNVLVDEITIIVDNNKIENIIKLE